MPAVSKNKGGGADLTHLDPSGRARMVDVGTKGITRREAWAGGTVHMKPETLERVRANSLQKGDVLGVAKVAGILAAKKTPEWIPLCHPLHLTQIELFFRTADEPARIEIEAQVKARDRTGVEMEALTAVCAAALTIYDMCKAVDRGMIIGPIGLLRKMGGESGPYARKKLPAIRP
ncbi:MAG: cyclic pyranopterin monophosphate synthase MoaC [Desulfobacterota bacterium]|jgi:cyclic pyranopterin phosphate synthase|nr:cyclic pyranopterin monophosphate synthase MoaC [Thermodesulfobacteriota bacterium]